MSENLLGTVKPGVDVRAVAPNLNLYAGAPSLLTRISSRGRSSWRSWPLGAPAHARRFRIQAAGYTLPDWGGAVGRGLWWGPTAIGAPAHVIPAKNKTLGWGGGTGRRHNQALYSP